MKLSLAQLQANARQAGFPENQVAKAAAIAMYESNGIPTALNDGGATHTNEYSVGLYQINTLAHHGYTIAQLQDPLTNAQIAVGLLRNRPNWGDWYNSNVKYNNDYQGIASQSQAIYNSGGGTTIFPVDNSNIIFPDNSNLDSPDVQDDNTVLYVLLGVGALILLT